MLLVRRAWWRRPEPTIVEWGLVVLLVGTLAIFALTRAGGESAIPPWLLTVVLTAWVAVVMTYPNGGFHPGGMRWVLAGSSVLIWLPLVVPTAVGLRGLGFVAGFVAGLAAQVVRFRSGSTVADRQAVKWLLVGFVPAAAVLVGPPVLAATTELGPGILGSGWYVSVSHVAIWVVLACATAGLVVGERWQVEGLLRVVLDVVGCAFALVWVYWVLAPTVGSGWAAVVCVGLVIPLAAVVDRAARRVIYAGDPSRVLAVLGSRLRGALGPEQVAGEVARAVREGTGSAHVAVTLGSEVVAECGSTGEHPVVWFPVEFQGEQIGGIGVAPRPGEASLTARDREAVARVGDSCAAPLHAVASYRRLQAAREALVLAREEERRRLRRDLHDDLAPTLAGLSMRAAAAAQIMRSDPDRSADLLGGLTAGITAAVAQVREIAYDLRPPVLDDEGLVEALRQRVQPSPPGGPDVQIIDETDGIPLPAAVEIAALRIVQEAVANVRTHARADRCTVRIRRTHEGVALQIRDDGTGVAPEARRGVGLRSIEERASELGGRLHLHTSPAGTTLDIDLPCRAELS